MSKDYYPKVFSASIGGYMGPSYSVEWKGGQLKYTACRQGYKKLAKRSGICPDPGMAGWQEFWSEIDRLNVWQWKTCYDNPDIVDGIGWSLEIEYDGRKLGTGGCNAYPSETGGEEDSTLFEGFLKAVQKLTGREFG